MRLANYQLASVHPFDGRTESSAHELPKDGTLGGPLLDVLPRSPRTMLEAFGLLTRFNAAIAVSMPALCTAILAWWETGAFNGLLLMLTCLGVLSTSMGLNALSEYYEAQRFLKIQHRSTYSFTASYGLVHLKSIYPGTIKSLGILALLIGFVCCIGVAFLSAWPILFFSGFGFLLAYAYAMPPIRYSYWGWGVGELGLLLGYGILPAIGGYYAQAQTISSLALWTSIPFAIPTMLIFFHYNSLNRRRDWIIRKRTLPVIFGNSRAVDISAVLIIAAYVAIVLIVSISDLPLWTLVCLATLPKALQKFAKIERDAYLPMHGYMLYKATIQATISVGLLFIISLWADKFF